jgi:hypothetical protein
LVQVQALVKQVQKNAPKKQREKLKIPVEKGRQRMRE